MRWVVIVCAALAVFIAPALAIPTDDQAPPADIAQARAKVQAAEDLAGKNPLDGPLLVRRAKAAMDDPAFPQLSSDDQHEARVLYGIGLLFSKDEAGALAALNISSAMPDADGRDWSFRLSAAWDMHDNKAAAESLLKLVLLVPERLDAHADVVILNVASTADRYLSPADTAQLLETLHAKGWHPSNPFWTAEALRLPLMRSRMARGDNAGAAALVAEIDAATNLIVIRIDKRFDAVSAQNASQYDITAQLTRELVRAKAQSAAMPDRLEGVVEVAVELLNAGRDNEALAVVDAALARLKSDPKAFSDAEDKRNWILDTRARLLYRLGRFDEALVLRVQAAQEKEDGGVNVSQAINLGDLYVDLGRPKDALAAVSALGFMSGYGQMAFEGVRACAYAQLGDQVNLARSLGYLKSHSGDAPTAAANAELCAGDVDAAAAEIIAQLENPQTRENTLLSLQDYIDWRRAPFDAKMHAAWFAMRARPDVQAEIAKVGGIESWPFSPQE